jgi:hypothetical protein
VREERGEKRRRGRERREEEEGKTIEPHPW